MKIIIKYLMVLLPVLGFAQDPVNVPEGGCEPVGISTNPDKYINPNDPSGDLKWDWREEQYTIYLTNGGTPGVPVTIVNPFFDQSGNPNTFALANEFEKDFNPLDGWELLYRKFGSETQGVITPYFILYNKYTGTIRIFVNIVNAGSFPYTAGGINLTMERPSNSSFPQVRQTAVLNQVGLYSFAADEMQKNAKHFKPNSYENSGVNNTYYWLYADFTSLYDACTCGLVGDWYLSSGLVNNLEINLEANGTLTTIVENTSNPNETNVNGFFGELQEYLTFGSGVINGVSGVFASANKGFKDGQALVTNAQQFGNNTGTIFGKQKGANFARILGRILFEAPKVNMVFNLANTLITTVKKIGNDYDKLTNDSPKGTNSVGKSKVTESDLKVSITGTMKVNAPYVNDALRIPGSRGQGAIEFTNPVYHEVIGVWNLFEQPKFKLTKYPSPNVLLDMELEEFEIQPGVFELHNLEILNQGNSEVFPTISHLELEEMPKIILNPASNLKVVDVKYQVVFETEENDQNCQLTGVMTPGEFSYFEHVLDYCQFYDRHDFYFSPYADREDYVTSIGLELAKRNSNWSEATITSPFLKQSCLMDYPIMSYSTIKKPSLKVKVILEPINNDPGSEVDQVIFVHTFPGEMKIEESEEKYSITGTPHLDRNDPGFQPVIIDLPVPTNNMLIGYSSNSLLQNEQIAYSFSVLGDIEVANDVTFAPGNYTIKATGNIHVNKSLMNLPANTQVNFQAGKEIYVNPEAEVHPEIVLEINPSNVQNCELSKDLYPTSKEIRTFCNGNVYNDRSKPHEGKVNKDEPEVIDYLPIFKDQIEFDFNMFPNPTQNSTRIELTTVYGNETIRVTDMSGRHADVSFVRTNKGMTLNLSKLDNGVYQVQVTSPAGTITKQLMILK